MTGRRRSGEDEEWEEGEDEQTEEEEDDTGGTKVEIEALQCN